MDTTALVERMKKETLADIASGRVPATVASFSELHDYVDANEYGGFCEDAFQYDASDDAKVDLVNKCQSAVDRWIKKRSAGGPAPTPVFRVDTVYRVQLGWHFPTLAFGASDVAEGKLVKYMDRLGNKYHSKRWHYRVTLANNTGGIAWNAYVVVEGANKKRVERAAREFLRYARRLKGFKLLV